MEFKLFEVKNTESRVFEEANKDPFYCTHTVKGLVPDAQGYNVYLAKSDAIGSSVIATALDKSAEEWKNLFVNQAKSCLREQRAKDFDIFDKIRINAIYGVAGFKESKEDKLANLNWFEAYKVATDTVTIESAKAWQAFIPAKPEKLQAMFDLFVAKKSQTLI